MLVGHCTSKKNRNKRSRPALFDWTERQQISYDTLKEKLIKPPVLAYADYSKPYKIHTDASTTGLGAVLYQNQDGMDRTVADASHSFQPSEKNYPAHKLEFLALKWAITEKVYDYLHGATFSVVTYVFTTSVIEVANRIWMQVQGLVKNN